MDYRRRRVVREGKYGKRFRLEPLEDRRMLAVIVVDTLTDELDGSVIDADVSLRDAIAHANVGDMITFSAALDGGTLFLTLGELTITEPLTIDASALATRLTIDASGNDPTPGVDNGDGSRVFHAKRLTVSGLALTGADVSGGGGAILAENVTVRDSAIVGNFATAGGGGISAHGDAFFSGSVTVIDSTISGNSTSWRGGGIGVDYRATVTVSNSTITENSARRGGGGVFAYKGNVSVAASTISGNSAGAEGGSFYDGNGGGIYVDDGVATITSSTISGNSAGGAEGGITYGIGGGVFVNGDLVSRASTFSGNIAGTNGGGISASNVTITGSFVSGNLASGNGGGIYTGAGSVDSARLVTINSSTISGNRAEKGGGVWNGAYVDATVDQSTISGNTATGAGGGIFSDETVTVTNSTISENESGHNGGGISTEDSTMVAASTISGNISGGAGGGIYTESGDVTVTSSTVSGNSAGSEGGGIYTESGDVTINSSTISGNLAERVGGVYSDGRTVTIGNSIIAGNSDDGTAPDILNFRRFMTITNTLIGDNTASGLREAQTPDALGNLIGDPNGDGVVDPLLGPLGDHGGATQTHSLLPGSPAINAGGPSHIGIPDHDQRGAPFVRISDGRMDMGAYELQPLPADFDLDGDADCVDVDRLVTSIVAGNNLSELDLTEDDVVDRADLDTWLSLAGTENLLSREPYLAGDANLDGKVDANDLNILGLNWLQNVNGWCSGDVSADGLVDANDLNALALTWLKDVSGAAAAATASSRPPRAPLAKHVDGMIAAAPAWRDSSAFTGGSESLRGDSNGRPSNSAMMAKAEAEGAGNVVSGRSVHRRLRYYVTSTNAHWQSLADEPLEGTEIDDSRLVDVVLRRW